MFFPPISHFTIQYAFFLKKNNIFSQDFGGNKCFLWSLSNVFKFSCFFPLGGAPPGGKL